MENTGHIHITILNNGVVTLELVADQLQISRDCTHETISSRLEFFAVCARCVH
jgi:hypothetical protein